MAPAAISIVDRQVNEWTHSYFDVTLDSNEILTLVTSSPSIVDQWISETLNIPLSIVGLDVEWRPNFSRNSDNPIATLQLCVGLRCLIFQLIYAPEIPKSLIDFLKNESLTFVGVGIKTDVEKLTEDYELEVSNMVDLRDLAVNEMGRSDLRNSGLKELARVVLGKEIHKPKNVTMSRWDREWLSLSQIQYACIDAYLSYEIARHIKGL